KIRFVSIDLVHRVEAWFRHYGYWVIIGNRFLAGTRAVISFVAGVSEMNLMLSTLLSCVSALAWNSILVYLGYMVGDNWRIIGDYLTSYSKIVTGILVFVLLVWLAKSWFVKKRNSRLKTLDNKLDK
ncbi:MAG: DedA family protein, partial [Bacteroidota bacterium]